MTNGGIGERSARLTPREWRVVALVMEGVAVDHACELLGVAPGTFDSHKQAIRRKLAVPRGERLEVFLRAHVGEIPVPVEQISQPPPEAPDAGEGHDDRRLRWLLRITLRELADVSASAGLRSELLAHTVRRMGTEDPGDAEREVRELQYVAHEISETYKRLLDDVRSGKASQS